MPTSASSAAATPGSRRCSTSPSAATTRCCSRPPGSAPAPRAATAASWPRASASPRTTLEAAYGLERARLLWQLAEEAKATVKQLISAHAIACDLRPGILDAAHKPAHADLLRAEAAHLASAYAYPHARYVPRDELRAMLGTARYFGGLLDKGGAHLHPLNYALGLAAAATAAGGRIFERSRVIEVGENPPRVRTAAGEVSARYLVLAMNGHLGRLVPALAGRIMPINNFMLATAPLGAARRARADPGRRRGRRHQVRDRLLPLQRRPPPAVRRRRELFSQLSGESSADRAALHAEGVPAARGQCRSTTPGAARSRSRAHACPTSPA